MGEPKARKKIGEILIDEGEITPSQLQNALNYQKSFGGKLGQCLVMLGYIEEMRLCEILSRVLRVPVIDLSRIKKGQVTPTVLSMLDVNFVFAHDVLPLNIRDINGVKHLVVVSPDPSNIEMIRDAEFKTGYPIFPMIAPHGEVKKAIDEYYRPQHRRFKKGEIAFDAVSCVKDIRTDMEIIRKPLGMVGEVEGKGEPPKSEDPSADPSKSDILDPTTRKP